MLAGDYYDQLFQLVCRRSIWHSFAALNFSSSVCWHLKFIKWTNDPFKLHASFIKWVAWEIGYHSRNCYHITFSAQKSGYLLDSGYFPDFPFHSFIRYNVWDFRKIIQKNLLRNFWGVALTNILCYGKINLQIYDIQSSIKKLLFRIKWKFHCWWRNLRESRVHSIFENEVQIWAVWGHTKPRGQLAIL